MPPLSTRIYQKTTPEPLAQKPAPAAPFDGNEVPWSSAGNGAPYRGVFPPEFVYDFSVNRYYPSSFSFVRGTVDTITPVRNLSLQAAAAAGIKVT